MNGLSAKIGLFEAFQTWANIGEKIANTFKPIGINKRSLFM